MRSSEDSTLAGYLDGVRREFGRLKRQADSAIAQVDDRALTTALDAESNSIAVLMRHLGGNLRSRWTDFLSTDGEKPDRHRDREFELDDAASRLALLEEWDRGWTALTETLASLTPGDLDRTVYIRSEPHSVLEAIQRGLTHAATHVGQIVLLAKHAAGSNWRTLSIPRGQSEAFNTRLRGQS